MNPDLPRIELAYRTDKGKIYDHNEDYLAHRIPEDAAIMTKVGALFIVADGVGGAAIGEVASRMAAEQVLDEYYRSELNDPTARLIQAFKKANERVYRYSQEQSQGRIGTTLVAAVVRGRDLIIANVGDSRAYLIRAGKIDQLSTDHSLVETLFREGAITAEEAKHHPRRNILLRTIGSEPDVEVETRLERLRDGDYIVLCTDGLVNHLEDREIAQIATGMPPKEAVKQLVDTANERGGKDNITVMILRIFLPEPLPDADTMVAMRTEPSAFDTVVLKRTSQSQAPPTQIAGPGEATIAAQRTQPLPSQPQITGGVDWSKIGLIAGGIFALGVVCALVGFLLAGMLVGMLSPPPTPTHTPTPTYTLTPTPTITPTPTLTPSPVVTPTHPVSPTPESSEGIKQPDAELPNLVGQ